MREHTLDALGRRLTAVVSRRRSFVTVGATALAATTARPATVGASTCGDRVRKARERCQKALEDRCLRQRNRCVGVANAICGADLGCIANTHLCCRLFDKDCDATAAVECLLARAE